MGLEGSRIHVMCDEGSWDCPSGGSESLVEPVTLNQTPLIYYNTPTAPQDGNLVHSVCLCVISLFSQLFLRNYVLVTIAP